MAHVPHSTIRSSAEMELANVMRIDEEERDIVSQFFAMLGDKGWRHATHSNGTDIFKLPGERIHRIMGVTRTTATPEEVLSFFSEPKNFKKNFTILDDMFKDGTVVKIGGDGLELDATGPRQRMHKLGNFAALSIGGKDRSGPTDPNDLADGAIGYFSKLRRSGPGQKLEAFIRSRRKGEAEGGAVNGVGVVGVSGGGGIAPSTIISELPSSQDASLGVTLAATASSSSSASTSSYAASPSASDDVDVSGGGEGFGSFKDRPGHALLHGVFMLPSIVPDRDFVWDQVAMRLPTGSVLIAGRSVDDDNGPTGESGGFRYSGVEVPCPKGHVRGAVLTSGYYIVPDQEKGGSTVHFVVQADPKGSLPAWVVNLVAPKQAHNVSRLRNYLDAGGR